VAHHRGLVITLVIAVVLAGVGIGVLALTTNDTDEPVQAELSVRHYAESAVGWPANDFGINVVNTTGHPLKLVPTPNVHQCVYNNATVFLTNPNRVVELRVSRRNSREEDGCTVAVSGQRWNLEFSDGTSGKWRLNVDADGETRSRVSCNEADGDTRPFACTPTEPETQGDPVGTIGIAPR
jgi:hypothetical protein